MTTVTHDEADIFVIGRIFAQTGKDIYNNKLFLTTGYLTAKPSFPIYLSALGSLFLPAGDPFFSRLPFALLNSLTPIFLFLIIFKITKNWLFAMLNALVFNFSPWFGALTATGYEAFLAFLFLLIAFYCLIAIKKELYCLLLAVFFFFLAFNSYMGTKAIFPLFVFYLLIYSYYLKNQLSWKKVFFCLIITAAVNLFLFELAYLLPNRSLILGEMGTNVLFFTKAKIDGLLWYANLVSQGPWWMKKILINRVSIPLWDSLVKYCESFNLKTLFITGENSPYGFGGLLGVFYFVDIFTFFIGVITITRMQSKKIVPLFLLFLFGGIPNAIATNEPSIVLRGFLLIVPYTMLISWGLFYLLTNKKKALAVYLIFLILNICYFQLTFYSRVKVIMSDQYHVNEYKLIKSIDEITKGGKKITKIYVEETNAMTLLGLYYHRVLSQSQIEDLISHTYKIEQIPLDSGCPKSITAKDNYILRSESCKNFLAANLVKQKTLVFSAKHSGNDYLLISLKTD